MREIEFRGKRIDNGEWIYGYYVGFGSLIVFSTIDGFTQNDYGSRCTSTRVNPKSVGQFTGLLDKNGKKIFTGDIIEEGVVYFDDEYLGYFVKGDFVEGEHKPLYDIPLPEIIGNVHNNPELLK